MLLKFWTLQAIAAIFGNVNENCLLLCRIKSFMIQTLFTELMFGVSCPNKWTDPEEGVGPYYLRWLSVVRRLGGTETLATEDGVSSQLKSAANWSSALITTTNSQLSETKKRISTQQSCKDVAKRPFVSLDLTIYRKLSTEQIIKSSQRYPKPPHAAVKQEDTFTKHSELLHLPAMLLLSNLLWRQKHKIVFALNIWRRRSRWSIWVLTSRDYL